ncbi:MAG: hypothetical protein QXW67_03490 [Candidatus Micrarchaeia archaeon]
MAILQFSFELIALKTFFDKIEESRPFRSLSKIVLSNFIKLYDNELKLKSITFGLYNGKYITGYTSKIGALACS